MKVTFCRVHRDLSTKILPVRFGQLDIFGKHPERGTLHTRQDGEGAAYFEESKVKLKVGILRPRQEEDTWRGALIPSIELGGQHLDIETNVPQKIVDGEMLVFEECLWPSSSDAESGKGWPFSGEPQQRWFCQERAKRVTEHTRGEELGGWIPFFLLVVIDTSRKEISAARAELKIFTDAVRCELYDVEARVARLRQSLQAAEQSYANAKRVLDAHVMLNSPLESLPTEILSYIFSLTFKKPFPIFEVKARMPWLLGQVCRKWRALAWQTPTLWNLFKGRDNVLRKVCYEPKLEEVLNRLGNSALHVSLDNLMPSCARTLARHMSCLLELEVRCWFTTLYVRFPGKPTFPRLRMIRRASTF
ncbi:hypothetical protein CPB85DRAFT_1459396 [Mucidula mucida]|nr:hypothetical protein CPB85DRAFT_1459396 [Mucidula mucida]